MPSSLFPSGRSCLDFFQIGTKLKYARKVKHLCLYPIVLEPFDGDGFSKYANKLLHGVFAVCPFKDMDASRHLVVWNINRHGLHIADIVYGIFSQHSDKAGLTYKFQQRVDLVQLYTNFKIAVI